MNYGAKNDYQTEHSAKTYEQRSMYKGFVGARRVKIETSIINQLAAEISPDSVILDCPCGNGRWFDSLSANAKCIIGIDVSVSMVQSAKSRPLTNNIELAVSTGDAENLDIDDNAVDYTFSYALMKHLPLPIQYTVLKEFSRVSSKGVICSFALLSPLSYIWWKFKSPTESYPLIPEELEIMAKQAGLSLEKVVKVSQPLIGLEYFAVFKIIP